MFQLNVAVYIDSAHFLNGYPGKCANIHGHTWKVEAVVRGEKVNDIGLLIDFNEIKTIIIDAVSLFDHKLINDIEPFNRINPSSENMAQFFYFEIKKKLSHYENIKLYQVVVSESRDTAAVYFEE